MLNRAFFSVLLLVFVFLAHANPVSSSYDLISTFDEIDPFETELSTEPDESLIADTFGCSSSHGQSASKLRARGNKKFCTPKKSSNQNPTKSGSNPEIPAYDVGYTTQPILDTDFKVDRKICPSSIYGRRSYPVCDSGYPSIHNSLSSSTMSFNLKFCIPRTSYLSLLTRVDRL